MAGPLNLPGKFPLVLGAISRNSPGNDFPPLGQEIFQQAIILIINLQGTVRTKTTDLSPRIFPSACSWFILRSVHQASFSLHIFHTVGDDPYLSFHSSFTCLPTALNESTFYQDISPRLSLLLRPGLRPFTHHHNPDGDILDRECCIIQSFGWETECEKDHWLSLGGVPYVWVSLQSPRQDDAVLIKHYVSSATIDGSSSVGSFAASLSSSDSSSS